MISIGKHDIWKFEGYCNIVIPTNIGWKSNGENVMGAGLAKQLSQKRPGIAKFLGETYKGGLRDVFLNDGFIYFPVKPLNEANPHLSWMRDATLEQVKESTIQLSGMQFDKMVVIPRVGCGNGKLGWEEVKHILDKNLDHRFLQVDPI